VLGSKKKFGHSLRGALAPGRSWMFAFGG